MAKFGYTSRRKMDPVVGRKFSTEYYKQSRKERARTLQHVDRVLQQLGEQALSDPEALTEITRPLKSFARKETQGHYSALDIIGDMSEQMHSGKDIPSGMLGRWNRLFANTGNEIDLVPEEELPPNNTYDNIFGAQQ
jgi:hypothetical protein